MKDFFKEGKTQSKITRTQEVWKTMVARKVQKPDEWPFILKN